MYLDLREFEAFPAEAEVEVETDNLDYESDIVALRDLVKVRLTIQEIGEEFFCQGQMVAPVEEECARCLTLFKDELTNDISFIVKIGEEKSNLAADDEEENIIYLKPGEHVVDLRDLIREAIILALPIKPLCDPECKGLCPQCGANLNEETCDCKVEEYDNRWEGLKDLLE